MSLPARLCPVLLLASVVLPVAARAGEPADPEQRIVELYQSGKLFDKKQHKAAGTAFADLFEKKHADVIRQAYGPDHGELSAWLAAHPDLRRTFYNALDERHDKLPAALALFKEIWKQFPDQVEKYGNLAVATAVVWDDDRRGVYDYRQHQQRTRSKMPEGAVDALGNFKYLVENDKVMEGRTRFLPWEFLVFVVDHRTPLAERKWAQKYYRDTRRRLASWHRDVPYDKDMLNGEQKKEPGLKPHLAGKLYTLANIRQYGGVCAMQADFATRVAKSVALPAAYCWGKSSYRGLHAWWLFVLVQKVSAESIQFRLVSDGRLEGFEKDLFYTGFVTDPQTGQQILDRDLERRLAVTGKDRTAKRQADLIMRAYPWLAERLGLDVKARVAYLDRCLKVLPQCEAAWVELARLARSGALAEVEKKTARSYLVSLSKTFAGYPDFVWRLYDDLLTVQPDGKERLKLYEQALSLFEAGKRADLACAARLKITDLLCEQEKWQPAARGLVLTIRKFPTEGRYVPRMTQKLQEISGKYKGGQAELARLYLELVPAMKAYYRGQGGPYFQEMYSQAVNYYETNNLGKYESTLRLRVQQ